MKGLLSTVKILSKFEMPTCKFENEIEDSGRE